MENRKYWDSDLKRDPSLISRAVEYVLDYYGNWEFLVTAKALAESTGSLPLGSAPAVLNCMRVDPSVVAPEPPKVLHPSERNRDYSNNVVPIRPVNHVVVKHIDANIYMPYGIAKNGRVLHRVKSGYVRWHRSPQDVYNGIIKPLQVDCLVVVWECGSTTKDPDLMEDAPEGVSPCRTPGCFSYVCGNCRAISHPDKIRVLTRCNYCGESKHGYDRA